LFETATSQAIKIFRQGDEYMRIEMTGPSGTYLCKSFFLLVVCHVQNYYTNRLSGNNYIGKQAKNQRKVSEKHLNWNLIVRRILRSPPPELTFSFKS